MLNFQKGSELALGHVTETDNWDYNPSETGLSHLVAKPYTESLCLRELKRLGGIRSEREVGTPWTDVLS